MTSSSFRRVWPLSTFTCIVFAYAFAGVAAAQSPGSSGTSSEPTLAQDFESAPKPGESGAQFTLGGQLSEGRTETKGLNIDGIIAHQTKKRQVWRADVETSYAWYRGEPGTPAVKAEDKQYASLTYWQPWKKVYLLGMGYYRRDAILGLDYRAAGEAGVGKEIYTSKKVTSFVGGSFAFGREHRNFTDAGEEVRDVGVLQTLNIRVTGLLGFEEWFKAHIDTSGADDGDYTFNASFLAKVSKYAGMKIYYTRQYDALHPASQSAAQSTIGAGVSITLPAAGGTK